MCSRPAKLVVVALAIMGLTIGIAGCSATPAAKPGDATATPGATSTSVGGQLVQLCVECGGRGAPAETEGEAITIDGVQTISIVVDGGYYIPNRITAQAGSPIRVVLTADAAGCVAEPTFESLGKSADLTASGATTIELGAAAAGTYEFTCAMDANRGAITVQ